jgi:hypothetical protein
MRRVMSGLLAAAAGIGAWTGCTDQIIAPGNCPDFCPNGQIVLHDTIFTTIIERDSSFRGYTQAYQSDGATAAAIPGVESRPFFKLDAMITRVRGVPGSGTDTSTVPIFADSSRLRVTITRKDTSVTNLLLKFYALPLTVDTVSTFADLDPYFSGPALDSVNVSDLRSRPLISDTATVRIWGDTIQTDSAGHVLIVRSDSAFVIFSSLDTLQAPFNPADSGRLAFGVRVAADSAVSIALGTNESVSSGPVMEWFYHYTLKDSTTAKSDSALRAPSFDSFVFDPPSAPLDSNLTVGGVPSARSLLRVNIPPFLHDSIDVVRATVVLVPVAPFPGVASDSFSVLVRAVLADLGAKSPLALDPSGLAVVHTGSTDTVRIDMTNLVRGWTLVDTTVATAFFLGQLPEATSFTEIRFYSSRAPAFRPALHVTYIKRFPFGQP